MARRALLIANGTFDDNTIAPLRAPLLDAQRLGELLSREDVGAFATELADDLESHALRRRILQFFKAAGPNDQTIIYFSGHGDKNAQGELYLNTKDTDPELLEATAVPTSYLMAHAQRSLSKQTIFIVDCCYSGAFAASLGVKSSAPNLTRDDFPVEGDRGMAVITASASLQPAREDTSDAATGSLFTRHLIEGIETGGADFAKTGTITLANLFHYAKDALRKEGAKQEPRSFFFGLSGAEAIALNPHPLTQPVPQELIDQCSHHDWRERRDAIYDLKDLAETKSDAVSEVISMLLLLVNDPDDRVKKVANRVHEQVTGLTGDEVGVGEEVPPPLPPSPPDIDGYLLSQPEIKAALESGAKIAAVKLVRQITQWSLTEAKAWVEPRMKAKVPPPPPKDDSWLQMLGALALLIGGGFGIHSCATSNENTGVAAVDTCAAKDPNSKYYADNCAAVDAAAEAAVAADGVFEPPLGNFRKTFNSGLTVLITINSDGTFGGNTRGTWTFDSKGTRGVLCLKDAWPERCYEGTGLGADISRWEQVDDRSQSFTLEKVA